MAFDFIQTGDVVKITAVIYNDTNVQLGLNDWYYVCDSFVGSGASTQDAVDQWSTGAAPFYYPLFTSNSRYYGAMINRYRTAFPVTKTRNSANSRAAGTAAGFEIPTQVSGLITKETDVGGRSGRGRAYIPFPDTTAVDIAGHPSALYKANLTLLAGFAMAAQIFNSAGNTSNCSPCLFRPGPPVKGEHITQMRVSSKFATQRRRGDYGRLNAVPFVP